MSSVNECALDGNLVPTEMSSEEVERRAQTMTQMHTEYTHQCRKLWELFEPKPYPLQEKYYANQMLQKYLQREIYWYSLRWTAIEAKGLTIGVNYVEEKELKVERDKLLTDLRETFEAALTTLASVTREEMSILRQYAQPPPIVYETLRIVYMLRQEEENFSWEDARILLCDNYFFGFFQSKARGFDIGSITDAMMERLSAMIQRMEFDPERVAVTSTPTAALVRWIHALYDRAHAERYLSPLPVGTTSDDLQRSIAQKRHKLQELKDEIVDTEKALHDMVTDYEERKRALQIHYDQVMEPLQDAFFDAHKIFVDAKLRGINAKMAK